jgi:hypothetical protein
MNFEKAFQNYLRGWFPQEPTLSVKSAGNAADKSMTPQQQTTVWIRALIGIVVGAFNLVMGLVCLFWGMYLFAVFDLASAFVLITLGYGIYKYHLSVRTRFSAATFFIFVGSLGIFTSDIFIGIFSFPALFAAPLLETSGGVAVFLGVISLVLAFLTFAYWLFRKLINPILSRFVLLRSDYPATKLQLFLPYAAMAILIFSTYLFIISGLYYVYALPITFLVVGLLTLRGLGRFAKTVPAFLALAVCILLLGYCTSQVPNANFVNVTVNTMQGDIRVYFTDDNSQICQVAFVKQYGPATVGRGTEFHPPNAYDSQPANNFNYTAQDGQVTVYADSYRTLVNITLNENLKYNLNFFTYFGGITIHTPPEATTIQSTNLTSQWGYVQTLQN